MKSIFYNGLRNNLILCNFYEVLCDSVLLAVNRATATVQSGSTTPRVKSRPHVCAQARRQAR